MGLTSTAPSLSLPDRCCSISSSVHAQIERGRKKWRGGSSLVGPSCQSVAPFRRRRSRMQACTIEWGGGGVPKDVVIQEELGVESHKSTRYVSACVWQQLPPPLNCVCVRVRAWRRANYRTCLRKESQMTSDEKEKNIWREEILCLPFSLLCTKRFFCHPCGCKNDSLGIIAASNATIRRNIFCRNSFRR